MASFGDGYRLNLNPQYPSHRAGAAPSSASSYMGLQDIPALRMTLPRKSLSLAFLKEVALYPFLC